MLAHGAIEETQIIYQPVCYFSTPEYLKTFWGKRNLIYCKGSAQVTNTCIRYRSDKINFDLPIPAIADMSIGSFHKGQIIQLHYLALTYPVRGGQRTVLLVPAKSRFTPSWSVNRIIEHWYETIQSLRGQSYNLDKAYLYKHDWPYDPDEVKTIHGQEVGNRQKYETVKDDGGFSFSNLPPALKIILAVLLMMLIIVTIGGTLTMGVTGLIFGVVLILFLFIPLYFYFFFQYKILSHIRKNRDKNILFKMWAEFEEGEFLGPFQKPK